jgi:hypothetical protein
VSAGMEGLEARHSPSNCSQEFGQSNEVVGCGCDGEHPPHSFASSVLCLPEASGGLQPAEGLLDAFANALVDRVAGVADGAPVDGRAAFGLVLRHIRRDTEGA